MKFYLAHNPLSVQSSGSIYLNDYFLKQEEKAFQELFRIVLGPIPKFSGPRFIAGLAPQMTPLGNCFGYWVDRLQSPPPR